MPSVEELELLPTRELHDRAFAVAKRRLDVRFFWDLLATVPAAEAAAGHPDEAEQDVNSLAERVRDLVHPDTTEESDALRPVYIEYLRKHQPDRE